MTPHTVNEHGRPALEPVGTGNTLPFGGIKIFFYFRVRQRDERYRTFACFDVMKLVLESNRLMEVTTE